MRRLLALPLTLLFARNSLPRWGGAGSVVLAALALTLLLTHNATAAVSYSTAGEVYLQNFNSPAVPANSNPLNIIPNTDPPQGVAVQYNGSAHIQNGTTPWPGGWKDDYTRDETYLGLPGWYLWHDTIVGTDTGNGYYTTGGANGHAHFRYGGGGSPQGTGGNDTGGTGFFFFSQTTCVGCGEKALGIRSASTFTNSSAGRRSYIGLQLINDTNETLNSFTIIYDGEQYSEAGGNSRDGFDLQWSLSATAADWQSSTAGVGFYSGTSGVHYGGVTAADPEDPSQPNPIPGGFLSPINNNPTNAIATNDQNPNDGCFNCVVDITYTKTGITWAPGTELWIRWRDGDAHDGIAIDNVRFTALASAPGPLLGDFNSDGKVDAGDYVTWRKNEVANATLPNDNGLTDQADRFTLWRANFGNPSGVGSGAGLEGANVPEPSAIVLVVACLAALPLKRSRVR